MHLAVCRVLGFDDAHGMYEVHMLTKGLGNASDSPPSSPARLPARWSQSQSQSQSLGASACPASCPTSRANSPSRPASATTLNSNLPPAAAAGLPDGTVNVKEISAWHDRTAFVPPAHLHVALQHLVDEHTKPILAAPGQCPLDLAAAALAGAPASLPRLQVPSPRAPLLEVGTTVRLIGRPERWLHGRLGTIGGWDEDALQYLVHLPLDELPLDASAPGHGHVPGLPARTRLTPVEPLQVSPGYLETLDKPDEDAAGAVEEASRQQHHLRPVVASVILQNEREAAQRQAAEEVAATRLPPKPKFKESVIVGA